MGGNDLIPFLLGIAWPQYLKLQEQHQKLHAGPGQGPGAGAPMGELSPEVAGILQMPGHALTYQVEVRASNPRK